MRSRVVIVLTTCGIVAASVYSLLVAARPPLTPGSSGGSHQPPPANTSSPEQLGVPITTGRADSTGQFRAFVDGLFDSPDSAQKLESLDQAFAQFIEDAKIPRADKIKALFELLNSRPGDQALFILDNLAHLHPVERASELIEIFNSSENAEFRSHVLTTLRDLLTCDWSSSSLEKPQVADIESAERAVSDLTKSLVGSDNATDARYAILEMVPLLPQSEQEGIMRELNSTRREERSITGLDWSNLNFDLAVANADERSLVRFRTILDQKGLESDPDFVDRVLSTLIQTALDPRFKDFSREILGRTGDLTLSPMLFVKARELELRLGGTAEEAVVSSLIKQMENSSPVERAAIIIGEPRVLMELYDEPSKNSVAVRDFIREAQSASGASRDQLLLAGLLIAQAADDPVLRESFEREICAQFSIDLKRTRCVKF